MTGKKKNDWGTKGRTRHNSRKKEKRRGTMQSLIDCVCVPCVIGVRGRGENKGWRMEPLPTSHIVGEVSVLFSWNMNNISFIPVVRSDFSIPLCLPLLRTVAAGQVSLETKCIVCLCVYTLERGNEQIAGREGKLLSHSKPSIKD